MKMQLLNDIEPVSNHISAKGCFFASRVGFGIVTRWLAGQTAILSDGRHQGAPDVNAKVDGTYLLHPL